MDDYRMVDAFDRLRAGFDGRPDVVKTRISTVRNVDPLVGNVTTFLVESVRAKDQGDMIFLEVASKDGNVRIGLQPKGTEVIGRQHERLTTKVKRKNGREQAKVRKDKGIAPFGGKPFRRTA